MALFETSIVEQLFLDLSIQDILNNTLGMPLVEPWASTYIDAIRDRRYGDAIWARYHLEGDIYNGIIGGTTLTVLQSIEEDAAGYRVNAPEQYAEAVSFYAKTNEKDGHMDVIKVVLDSNSKDIAQKSRL